MKKLKGFTLIEILVAIAIFSFAVIISSGIFANVIGNQSLVFTNSKVNHEGQRILRQISDDVVNATVKGSVKINGNTDQSIKPNGILFLTEENAIAATPENCISNSRESCNFYGLVLFSESGIKIYRFNKISRTIEYGLNSSDPTSTELILDNGVPAKLASNYVFSTLNNNDVEIVSSNFSGISCVSSSCSQSPFVKINFITQTKNYENRAARHRAKIELRTMVSSRSY